MALGYQCERELGVKDRYDYHMKCLSLYGNEFVSGVSRGELPLLAKKQYVVADLYIEEGKHAKNAWVTVLGNRAIVMVGDWLFMTDFSKKLPVLARQSIAWSSSSHNGLDRRFRMNRAETHICAELYYACAPDSQLEDTSIHLVYSLPTTSAVLMTNEDAKNGGCGCCKENTSINNFQEPEQRLFFVRRITDTHFQVVLRGIAYLQKISCNTRSIPEREGEMIPQLSFKHSTGKVEIGFDEKRVVEEGDITDDGGLYAYSSQLPGLIKQQIEDDNSDTETEEDLDMDNPANWIGDFYMGPPSGWDPSKWKRVACSSSSD